MGRWCSGTVRVTCTPVQIQEAVDKSLSRLGVDFIDLLQIHWPDRYVPLFGSGSYNGSEHSDSVPFDEQLRGVQNVIEQGKVVYHALRAFPAETCRYRHVDEVNTI